LKSSCLLSFISLSVSDLNLKISSLASNKAVLFLSSASSSAFLTISSALFSATCIVLCSIFFLIRYPRTTPKISVIKAINMLI